MRYGVRDAALTRYTLDGSAAALTDERHDFTGERARYVNGRALRDPRYLGLARSDLSRERRRIR